VSPPAQTAALRRQQNRAEVRRTILDASEALLAESGYRGFSVRALVDRCGYSAPTLYHHFGDKPGLLDAVLEERLKDLVAELERVPSETDLIAQVRRLCLVFARWGIRNPMHYYLMNQPREREPLPGSASHRAVELLSKPVTTLSQHGDLSESEVALVRQSLWACLHGLISLPAVRPDEDWSENLLEASLDALLRGWLPELVEAAQTERGGSSGR